MPVTPASSQPTPPLQAVVLPREGMVANVRNRRAVITQVTPFDTPSMAGPETVPAARLHLVTVDYSDLELPSTETLLWEREVAASITPPRALPDVLNRPAMNPGLFDALTRAARWQALTPFITPDGTSTAPRLPIASPFHGAVQVEDYQLEPLLRALQMPRVNLLLADDVGLGKTIEAGLILSELLLRRRIRRVLILTPGSLRDQWQEEMHDKFSIHFDVVDRDATWQLRKRIGLDANPWRTFPRIVASYHYLRQPDVLEQFLSTCRDQAEHVRLPWDLLIVDEAHNLMPSPFGEDSDLVEMLRAISPYFEHKLFLTATPHNGHTESFSGLLELLDPVRFTRTDELSTGDRQRLDDVLIRRLKRDISAFDTARKRPARFGHRFVTALPVTLPDLETKLVRAFSLFKRDFFAELASRKNKSQLSGRFALTALEKRLLSCPATFADSWFRLLDGLADKTDADPSDTELDAANRATHDELIDDAERAHRERTAARVIGAWLRPLATGAILPQAIARVTDALNALNLHSHPHNPKVDGRFAALSALIATHLSRPDGSFSPDERLIIFTEYKTTLDYLSARLRRAYPKDTHAIAELYGGMDKNTRLSIRTAFNDPNSPIRILVATDAASEGLNLQETARYLLHFDVPWNPSRLEQRNGRLDRHGQARDVTVFHFSSTDDDDLAFLGRVVQKVDQIREDLGAVGEVFDAAFSARFDAGQSITTVNAELDEQLAELHAATALPTTAPASIDASEVEALMRDIDLSPDTLAETLALALQRDHGELLGPDADALFRLGTIPARWSPVIDDHLRLGPATRAAASASGALPSLAFDPRVFVETRDGRPVFRPKRSTALLHLAHPVYRHTLGTLSRLRFDATGDDALSRWTVRRVPLPSNTTALIVITVEELVINRLREPFHHWVRTLRFPVGQNSDSLLAALPYASPTGSFGLAPQGSDVAAARIIWDNISEDLNDALEAHALAMDAILASGLDASRVQSLTEARTSFKARRNELSRNMNAITPERIGKKRRHVLERELKRLQLKAQQFLLPGLAQSAQPSARVKEIERTLATLDADVRVEADRRRERYRKNLDLLASEERRVLEQVLPLRFALNTGRGARAIQLYPISLEIQLPLHGAAK